MEICYILLQEGNSREKGRQVTDSLKLEWKEHRAVRRTGKPAARNEGMDRGLV